jgi:hypothetical protein
MNRTGTAHLHDTKVDVKLKLCGLWIATLFLFVYVDLFGFFRAEHINSILAGKLHDTGLVINQAFLVFTTAYIAVPSLMVVVSLLASARMNRIANIAVSLFYAVTAALSAIGETWVYFILGIAIEVLLLLAITRVAWTWPRRSTQ